MKVDGHALWSLLSYVRDEIKRNKTSLYIYKGHGLQPSITSHRDDTRRGSLQNTCHTAGTQQMINQSINKTTNCFCNMKHNYSFILECQSCQWVILLFCSHLHPLLSIYHFWSSGGMISFYSTRLSEPRQLYLLRPSRLLVLWLTVCPGNMFILSCWSGLRIKRDRNISGPVILKIVTWGAWVGRKKFWHSKIDIP